jgi:uncharacterized glyoxalase superfamily protein PhnB
MTSNTRSFQNGYHTVSPYLMVDGAEQLINFLKQVFHAQVTEHITRGDGLVAHADVQIGDSIIMLADTSSEWKPTPGAIYIYVRDTDATYQRALQAGSTSLTEPTDQFHGDRMAGVQDPFGNVWWIATHMEDVLPDELQKRADALS